MACRSHRLLTADLGVTNTVQRRFDIRTSAVLREARRRVLGNVDRDLYDLSAYLREIMSKITCVDAFYVGLIQGSSRVIFPYNFDRTQPPSEISLQMPTSIS